MFFVNSATHFALGTNIRGEESPSDISIMEVVVYLLLPVLNDVTACFELVDVQNAPSPKSVAKSLSPPLSTAFRVPKL